MSKGKSDLKGLGDAGSKITRNRPVQNEKLHDKDTGVDLKQPKIVGDAREAKPGAMKQRGGAGKADGAEARGGKDRSRA